MIRPASDSRASSSFMSLSNMLPRVRSGFVASGTWRLGSAATLENVCGGAVAPCNNPLHSGFAQHRMQRIDTCGPPAVLFGTAGLAAPDTFKAARSVASASIAFATAGPNHRLCRSNHRLAISRNAPRSPHHEPFRHDHSHHGGRPLCHGEDLERAIRRWTPLERSATGAPREPGPRAGRTPGDRAPPDPPGPSGSLRPRTASDRS